MAVAFDACSQGLTSGGSVTFSHTCTGSDRVLYVFIGIDGVSNFNPTVTYNSVSLTQLTEVTTNRYCVVLRLVNPSSGTNDVVVSTLPGGVNQAVFAISFTGVDQVTPEDATVTSNSAGAVSLSDAVTTATGDMLVDFITVDSTAGLAADGSQTIPTNGTADMAASEHGVSYWATNGSVNMGWSWTSSVAAAHLALNINAAGAAASSAALSTTRRLLMGVA
jgi:hypothetical protein